MKRFVTIVLILSYLPLPIWLFLSRQYWTFTIVLYILLFVPLLNLVHSENVKISNIALLIFKVFIIIPLYIFIGLFILASLYFPFSNQELSLDLGIFYFNSWFVKTILVVFDVVVVFYSVKRLICYLKSK